jgi:hypothetical protein
MKRFVAVTEGSDSFVVEAHCWYDASAACLSYLPGVPIQVLSEPASEDHPAARSEPALRAGSPHAYDVLFDPRETFQNAKVRKLPIVAFVGDAGSGKDTAAGILVLRGFCRVAFADVLKRFCQEVFGFSNEALWGPSELRNAPSGHFGAVPREALQTLGTEWGRALVDKVWVAYLIRIVHRLQTEDVDYARNRGLAECPRAQRPRGVVIPDLRFVNEWAGLQEAFSGRLHIYRIERKNNAHKLRGRAAKHASEQEFGSIPAVVIKNNASLEEFQAKILTLHESLCQRRFGGGGLGGKGS